MAKNSKDEAFKKPTLMKITGRTSSITTAFGNGIIPSIQPSDEEIDEALNVLGMTRENVRCAYCGVTEEWQTLDMFDGNRSNYTDRNFAPATVRYLRLFVVAPTQGQDSAARIYEFEVY